MDHLKELLGLRVLNKGIKLPYPYDSIYLEAGTEIEVLKYDEDFDRLLLKYPEGQFDWKHYSWIANNTDPKQS